MHKDKKLEEIMRKNAEFEKEAPYNFCDRWCERCPLDTQKRCTLYMEELDRRITNIAHGRNEDDLEILKEDYEKKLEELRSSSEQWVDEGYFDFPDFEYSSYDDYDEIKEKEEQLHYHPLQRIIEQYRKRAHNFLKETFYAKTDSISSHLHYDYETIAWYHTLLSAKMYRALCGLYVRDKFDEEEDFGLCDAVAQLAICKKAVNQSIKALRNIAEKDKCLQSKITQLLALLHNILSRIKLIEKEI